MDRLQRALDAIDAANAEDPTSALVRGRAGPKEVLHAELVTEWIARLQPDADDALKLAARGHHLRRWTSPRATYPAGRAGYLKWRKALHAQHARELGELLAGAGYAADTVRRVQTLVRKDDFGHDADAQTLEDALCLVFLETQLADIAARLEPETLQRVIVKTTRKMSTDALALVAEVPMQPAARRVLDEALARDVVERYLAALIANDWTALPATLAPDVHRVGPYRDVCDGREAYAAFLQETISRLSGYELRVHRTMAAGSTVTVELRETVDDGDERLCTDEAVVFDVVDGLIANVAVYLQTSERKPRD